LLAAFWNRHVARRYVKNGKPTSEQNSFRTALRPVRQLYGREPVVNFGPLALIACREQLVDAGICRTRVNQHVSRIRQAFRWGVARQLVPETVWRALGAVEGLREGEAVETVPVLPVTDEQINAIQPFVTPHIWAMIQFQLWTACRPGEACDLRTGDLTMAGDVWEYRPQSHKTEHHGKTRVIYLGPHAQEIVRPWLKMDLSAYVWTPREAREWHLAQRRADRKTPMTPSQRARRRKAKPQRQPGDHYNVSAYGHAIVKACEKAYEMPDELRKIPKHLPDEEKQLRRELASQWRSQHCWAPNQLRHTAATRIRAAYGIEASRVILGHSSAVTTEYYAEADHAKAREIMAQLG
jgi:integrase